MGWLVLLIVGLILASLIGGQSSCPSGTTGAKDCPSCEKDLAWYNSLSALDWRRHAVFAWYVTKYLACKAIGC